MSDKYKRLQYLTKAGDKDAAQRLLHESRRRDDRNSEQIASMVMELQPYPRIPGEEQESIQGALKVLKKHLACATSTERLEIFFRVSEGYCRDCGDEDPDNNCCCEYNEDYDFNDE